MSVPSPLPCPEPRQTSAGKDGQSPLSLAFSSTMFSQGLWRLLPLSGLLLPLSGLLLLVQPLEPSSPAAGDAGTWDAPAEALEEQDVAPLRATMLVLEALPWICTALALLLKGLRLCWVLGKGLRRRWGEGLLQRGPGQWNVCLDDLWEECPRSEWEPEEVELGPESMQLSQSSPVPPLAPVVFKNSRGGHNVRPVYHPFPQSTIRDLCKAHWDYGRESPYFRGLLRSDLGAAAVVPADLRQLFSCLMNSTEFKLWEAAWRQLLRDALPGLLTDPETAVDEEGNALTLDHLVGEGHWVSPTEQAMIIPPKALHVIRDHAVTAFFGMVPDGPITPYSKILQGPKESFTEFVERLTRAIEIQVPNASGLHLRNADWTIASVNTEEQGAWPVIEAADKAIIHHYMDDVLVCAPNDDVLSHVLDLTINALIAAGFELQEENVQRMPPWQYLGLEISKRTIVPQKLEIRTKNAPGLVRRFHLTREQAKAIVAVCPSCTQHALPTLSAGVNPRGLKSCEVWQTDVTHFPEFGRSKFVHVSVDTFSGTVFASAHTGEKSLDAIKHLIQAFSFMGIPRELKTDNGLAYRSKEFCSFLQQWGVEHKTGILHSPTGQAVVERTHRDIKRVLHQQQQVLKTEPPSIRLARALFTINFLNCSFEGLNPPVVRHFGANPQFDIKERPPVMVRNPETGKAEGPHDLVTWGRGYA
ncbi:hypothetical protein DUI87_05577 [Hirundo rustica rustica]|uniref:RNA-directed DNA polymerase n=1 Tax=Hirundo rustica rustica TaxID=333673 RepID=A0A3M0KXF0_HIRRU|nr:hypothetical protein DUI87_05577 [Hirundo rustica rustica]